MYNNIIFSLSSLHTNRLIVSLKSEVKISKNTHVRAIIYIRTSENKINGDVVNDTAIYS